MPLSQAFLFSQMMVVITDGGFGALSSMRESVKLLKSKGVNFVALGVGQIPELKVLQTITKYDDFNDRLLLVKRFENLKQYAQDVSDVACYARKKHIFSYLYLHLKCFSFT